MRDQVVYGLAGFGGGTIVRCLCVRAWWWLRAAVRASGRRWRLGAGSE